jgi:hypothetical protein
MHYRIFVCLTFALLVSACGSLKVAQLGATPTVDDRTLTVVDLRTFEQKQPRRDSNFSAILYLGDTEVNPSALLFLKSAVQRQAGPATNLSLEISELRVIDFFPVRLRAGGQGQGYIGKALMDGLVDAKTDFAFVEHLAVPESENSVICLVAGRLNGKLVKTATFRTYKESPMSVSIRNDPSFKSALVGSIEAAAGDLVSQFRAAP